jgi:hypothetical protein
MRYDRDEQLTLFPPNPQINSGRLSHERVEKEAGYNYFNHMANVAWIIQYLIL